MGKRTIYLLLLLPGLLWGQSTDLDSLRGILETEASSEKRLETLLTLGRATFRSEPEQSLAYAEEALQLSEQLQDLVGMGKAEILVGYYELYRGEIPAAMGHYRTAEKFFLEAGDSTEFYAARSEQSIGYFSQGNYEQAAEMMLSVLRFAERNRDSNRVAMTLNNLGTLYWNTGDLKEARNYLRRSYQIKQLLGQEQLLSSTLNNLANISLDLGEPDSAILYAEQALELNLEQGNLQSVAVSERTLGAAYLELKAYETATQHTRQALGYLQELNSPAAISGTLLELAQIEQAKGNPRQAKQYAEESLELNSRLDDPRFEIDLLKFLADLAQQQGQYQQGMEYLQRYLVVKDTVLGQDQQAELSRLQTLYETEKKDQQIAFFEQEKELREARLAQTRNGLILTGIIAVLLGGLVILFVRLNRQRRQANALLQEKNEQLAELNATKDRLFSIIAHDLKNPLSAFRSLTGSLARKWEKLDKSDIRPFIENLNESSGQLYELLQNLLQWALAQTGSLSVRPRQLEVEEIMEKVSLPLRSVAELQGVSLEVEEGEKQILLETDEQMLRTVLRNLVANAIKFTPAGGKVSLQATQEQQQVFIRVSDTGVGISPEDQAKLMGATPDVQSVGSGPAKGTGLGLVLCRELLQRIGGNLSLESELGKGSTFTVELPLNLKKDQPA